MQRYSFLDRSMSKSSFKVLVFSMITVRPSDVDVSFLSL